jgi:hypothetical protein
MFLNKTGREDTDRLLHPAVYDEDVFKGLIRYLSIQAADVEARLNVQSLAALLDREKAAKGLILYGERKMLNELMDKLNTIRGIPYGQNA